MNQDDLKDELFRLDRTDLSTEVKDKIKEFIRERFDDISHQSYDQVMHKYHALKKQDNILTQQIQELRLHSAGHRDLKEARQPCSMFCTSCMQ